MDDHWVYFQKVHFGSDAQQWVAFPQVQYRKKNGKNEIIAKLTTIYLIIFIIATLSSLHFCHSPLY